MNLNEFKSSECSTFNIPPNLEGLKRQRIIPAPRMRTAFSIKKQLLMRMKLTFTLLLTSVLFVNAKSFSQTLTLSLKNTSLSEVFSEIEKQSGYSFVYGKEQLLQAKKLNLEVTSAELKTVLDLVFKDQSLTYSISGKYISVQKKANRNRQGGIANAQTFQVKGRTVDENGQPLIGVNVIEKGTKNSVTTNENGEFSISVSSSNSLLVFTFVGKKLVERKVIEGETLTIKLVNIEEEIDAVVVTGYFEKSKQTFTGAATTFKGEDIRKISNQNVLVALSVIDPSFKLMDNNMIGSDPNKLPEFQIRGAGSIPSPLEEKYKGNPNIPTFMLDGFEVSLEKIYDLDPERILTVTILKDAAALAIYGSRGSNGVVVITTNPPKAGKLNATYSVNMNFEAADLSSYDLLGSADKLEYERLAGIYSPNNYISTGEAFSFYYNERLKLVQQGIDTDWLSKPVRGLGTNLKHALTLEGGDGTFRYAMDLSYNPSSGVMKGSGRDRTGIKLQLNYNYNNLRFSNQLSFDNVQTTNSPYGSFSTYAYLNPYYNPYDASGNVKRVLYNLESSQFPTIVVANPLYNATINTKDEGKYDNFINNFGMEWNVNPDLRVNAKLSISKKNQMLDVFKPSDHTDFLSTDKKGSYMKATTESFQYEGTAGLSYTKNIGKQLFVLNTNYNIQEIKDDTYTVNASGFPNDLMDHIGMGLEYLEGTKPQGYETTTRLMGLLGNLNYSYDNRFLADLSIRYDGSSQFGSKSRWGSFWSTGLGWNIHEESFLKDNSQVDVLRVRGSLGYTGAQSFYPYQSIMMYQYMTNITYDNYFGSVVSSYGNKDLKWQRTFKKNIGMDFELFDSAISGYVNFYSDFSKDVLVDVSMAPSLGFDTYKANLGEVENKGFEVSLKATLLANKETDFYWNVFGSAVHNQNKLSKISNSLSAYNDKADGAVTNRPSVRFIEGQSMNTLWVVKSLGIDPATGQEVFLDKNNNPTNVWSSADYVPYGNTDSSIEGTLGTNLGYKGFQMNVYLQYRAGGSIYNNTLVNRVENVDPNRNVDSRVFYDRWKTPGDISSFKGIANKTLTYPTSRFVEKDNRLDLKSINLSYTFNNSPWMTRYGLDRARLSAYLNDVFQITSVKAERGIDYPFARHYALALQVNF